MLTHVDETPRELVLDCRCMITRAQAHDHLAARLGLPAYYGRNLDALFDCVCELSGVRIVVEHPEALAALGGYGELLLNTLREAAEANPQLDLSVCP